MLYLSIALVLCTLIIVTRPPTIVFHKIMEVRQPSPPQEPAEITEDELKEMHKDAPPTLDGIMDALNLALHDISGGDMND